MKPKKPAKSRGLPKGILLVVIGVLICGMIYGLIVKPSQEYKLIKSGALRQTKITYGPWEAVHDRFGAPLSEYPSPYILQVGNGAPVQMGDIVIVRKYRLNEDATQVIQTSKPLWFWVVLSEEVTYRKCLDPCEVESAVVGMPTGSWFYYPIRNIRTSDAYDKPAIVNAVSGGDPVPSWYSASVFAKTYESENNFEQITIQTRTEFYHIVQRCSAQLRKRSGESVTTGPYVTPDWTSLSGGYVVDDEDRSSFEDFELEGECANNTQIFANFDTNRPGVDDVEVIKLTVSPELKQLPAQVPSPVILETIRATNTLLPADAGDEIHFPYVVPAGQRIKLNLRVTSEDVHGHLRYHLTSLDYHVEGQHKHIQLTQDAQGDYYYSVDADYRGWAYFYVDIVKTEARHGFTKKTRLLVPVQVVAPSEKLKLQLFKAMQASENAVTMASHNMYKITRNNIRDIINDIGKNKRIMPEKIEKTQKHIEQFTNTYIADTHKALTYIKVVEQTIQKSGLTQAIKDKAAQTLATAQAAVTIAQASKDLEKNAKIQENISLLIQQYIPHQSNNKIEDELLKIDDMVKEEIEEINDEASLEKSQDKSRLTAKLMRELSNTINAKTHENQIKASSP